MLALITTTTLALTSTSLTARPETACDTWQARIAAAAVARDYTLTSTEDGFTGRSSRDTRLVVSCAGSHASARVVDRDGSSAEFELSIDPRGRRHSFELTGNFPGAGTITQTHVFRATRGGVRGFSSYSALLGEQLATVETTIGRDRYAASGAVERVNDGFRPVLQASAAWRDSQALALAGAGLLDDYAGEAGAARDHVLDVMSTIAVPPRPPVKGSKAPTVVSCLSSGAICGATIFFAPLAPGCVAGTATCLANFGCYLTDC